MKRKEITKKASEMTAEKDGVKKKATMKVEKSKYTLWRESHPHGILKIIDMRAVLK
jgi:hypothetical protein